tara:strand:+ start:4193 stop:4357 length:165 start_codon:yes stop_codon:yes gene_type:complete
MHAILLLLLVVVVVLLSILWIDLDDDGRLLFQSTGGQLVLLVLVLVFVRISSTK